MQQKLAQLLLLQLSACLLKAFLQTENKEKWEAVHKFSTWSWIYKWFCNSKGCKKITSYLKKEVFFALTKLCQQTSNLAICLIIYVCICHMPMQTARIELQHRGVTGLLLVYFCQSLPFYQDDEKCLNIYFWFCHVAWHAP